MEDLKYFKENILKDFDNYHQKKHQELIEFKNEVNVILDLAQTFPSI